ncbi:VCBS repeat-containing protein [Clostridium sp.]|uniref:VCBS repeat-containing protein n=1 Tax=Clostridium sp. TaxID=1506 RepID=UPI002FC851F7
MKNMRNNTYILDFKQGDVNGDGFPEDIYLLGEKTSPDEFFSDNITLLIKVPKANIYIKVPLHNASGYNAELYLGHFTDHDKLDMLVSVDTGGSGRYILSYLYTLKNLKPVLIFDSNVFESNSNYTATFIDQFKVIVKSMQDNTEFTIDVSNNKEMYLEAGIYESSGKISNPTVGGVLGLGALWPLQENYNGLSSLLALQRIIGINNADNLGAVYTYLKWDEKKIVEDRVQIGIMPSYTSQSD